MFFYNKTTIANSWNRDQNLSTCGACLLLTNDHRPRTQYPPFKLNWRWFATRMATLQRPPWRGVKMEHCEKKWNAAAFTRQDEAGDSHFVEMTVIVCVYLLSKVILFFFALNCFRLRVTSWTTRITFDFPFKRLMGWNFSSCSLKVQAEIITRRFPDSQRSRYKKNASRLTYLY